MIDITPYQFDIVVSILKKHVPHCEVRVFGSRYKWTSKSYSDLDLAIVGTKKLDKKVIYDLKEAFSESDLPIRVDVLDWHAISEEFRQIIEQGYEVIQTKQLPDGWEVRKLGECCSKIASGATPTGGNASYKSNGIALVRSQNVLDFLFSYGGLAFIDNIQATKLKNVELEANDVLLNITGDSVARCCTVPPEILPARVNQHVITIRTKSNILDSHFLKYYLLNGKVKEKLLAIAASGATRKALTKCSIEKLAICIPKITLQKKIASILSSLDEKIDLNKQINKKLEEISQALFKQWFIDFNFPNKNGMPYKDSGGTMIDSELGKIPKGWQNGMIGDYVKIKSGFAFKSQWWTTTGVKVIKIKDISNNTISSDELSHISIDNAKKASDFSVRSGDLLIAMTGATVGKIGLVPETEFKLLVNQRVGKFFLGDKPIEKVGFLYMNLLQDNVAYQINARANGSAQANISPTDIESIKIVLPPKQIINIFNLTVTPIFEYICRNINQNNKLQQVRDSLLPKLMSGEVDVTHGV